ncbi:MAG: hypothetical protein RR312_08210 [Bacteroidales bacterium]
MKRFPTIFYNGVFTKKAMLIFLQIPKAMKNYLFLLVVDLVVTTCVKQDEELEIATVDFGVTSPQQFIERVSGITLIPLETETNFLLQTGRIILHMWDMGYLLLGLLVQFTYENLNTGLFLNSFLFLSDNKLYCLFEPFRLKNITPEKMEKITNLQVLDTLTESDNFVIGVVTF